MPIKASASLEAPCRLASTGDCHDQDGTRGRFLHPDMIFEGPYCQLDVGCVTLMCFYIGTGQLKKVHGWA